MTTSQIGGGLLWMLKFAAPVTRIDRWAQVAAVATSAKGG